MKYIILSILVLFSLSAYSQIEDTPLFVGKYFGNQSGGGSGYWQVTGNFTDESGYYDATSIQVGDVLFFVDAGIGYHLPVTSIISASGSSFTIRVNNTGISGVAGVPNGPGGIYRANSPKGIWPFTAGLTASDQQTLNSFLIKRLNNEPVKRDTFITVPHSTNYIPNLVITTPSRFYNNIYISCKGISDTSTVAFLAAPTSDHYGVVYNVKNDSGLVETRVLSDAHLSNVKTSYLLRRGQTAQVRALKDQAQSGAYKWAVNLLWDSTVVSGGGSGDVTSAVLADTAAAIRADFPNGSSLVQFTEPSGYAKINANQNTFPANLTLTDTLQNGGQIDNSTSILLLRSVNKGTPVNNPDVNIVTGTEKTFLILDSKDLDNRDPRDSFGVYSIKYFTNNQNRQATPPQKQLNYGYTIGVNVPGNAAYTNKAISNYWNYEQRFFQTGYPSAQSETYYNFENPMTRRGYRTLAFEGAYDMSTIVWRTHVTKFIIGDTTYREKFSFVPKARNQMSEFNIPDSASISFGQRTDYIGSPDGTILSQRDTGTTVGAGGITIRSGSRIIPSDFGTSMSLGGTSRPITGGLQLYTRSSLSSQGELIFPRTYAASGAANETSGDNYIHWRSTGFGLSRISTGATYFNVQLGGTNGAFNFNNDASMGINAGGIYRLHIAGSKGTVGVGIVGTYASNDIGLYIQPSSITGNFYSLYSRPNVTGNTTAWFGNDNTGSTSNAIVLIRSAGASTSASGKSAINLETLAGNSHILNARNSNSLEIRTGNSDIDAATTRLSVNNSTGNIKIGTGAGTARLDIAAGTATANTAPLKLTSGTNLATAEAGAIEYDGTEFYATNSTASRTIFARVLKGSGTLDFPDTASGSTSSLTITVTGAATTDSGVSVQRDNASISGTMYEWVITGANTVTVYFHNFSGSNQDPASGTFRATVTK